MCEIGSAVENIDDGNNNADTVVLSLMENRNNCSCYVNVENMNSNTILYIKPYNDLPASAPKEQLCGMIIDLFRIYPNQNSQHISETPIGCNSGQIQRSVTLTRENNKLEFISKIVTGNFTRGYCIQIIRVHNSGGQDDDKELKLICGNQDLSITTTLQYNLNGSFTRHTKTNSPDKKTVYISIGAVGGLVVFVSVLVTVIIMCKRRKLLESSKEESRAKCSATTPQTVVEEEEYDGLKYNMLYASSEQDDHLDANYSTVDGDIHRHKRIKDEVGSRTIEDQQYIQDSKLDTHFVTNNAQQTNEDKRVMLTTASSENGSVYAVVDKSNKTKSNLNNMEIKFTSQTYAIVNKSRKRQAKEEEK
ncbi:unnamed protein product [Mytilus coruscus]|uniref:Uncharacterized protein n=1 Tax=Mytilus coruscus TaxID=42192 RepID=A0A6J8EEN1_MYTCO|nr:unnamed protein product [Mytilus coruscus]